MSPEGSTPVKSEDTYEKAREASAEQVEHEAETHAANDALENDVLGLWKEHLEMPYGNFVLRVRSGLPKPAHDRLLELLKGLAVAETPVYIEILEILTCGLYKDAKLIYSTESPFWDDNTKWSDLKVQQVVGTYMKNYKREVDATTSFLNTQSTES